MHKLKCPETLETSRNFKQFQRFAKLLKTWASSRNFKFQKLTVNMNARGNKYVLMMLS